MVIFVIVIHEQLFFRVMEKLPNLKAPYTRGDYREMESENVMIDLQDA